MLRVDADVLGVVLYSNLVEVVADEHKGLYAGANECDAGERVALDFVFVLFKKDAGTDVVRRLVGHELLEVGP